MPRRSRVVRAGWLLATALQLALPGTAAWADARLDAVETHAVAHVESHTTESCARIHPPDCALCHFLTAPVLTGRPIHPRIDVAARQAPRPTDRTSTPQLLARPHPQPRAPPPALS